MHCSSSEALAQLVRQMREGLSLSPSLAQGLCGNPFLNKNGALQLKLTLHGMGVRAGRGMKEGTLLSIQILPRVGKGPRVWASP